MSIDYYDREGLPITFEQYYDLLLDPDYKRVAYDKIDETEISTVWLGLNHGFFGNIVLFESMIFGGPHDQHMWRYSTLEQAQQGHKRIVDALTVLSEGM